LLAFTHLTYIFWLLLFDGNHLWTLTRKLS